VLRNRGRDAISTFKGPYCFQGAVLEDAEFTDAVFAGTSTSFSSTIFAGKKTTFYHTEFQNEVSFENASFKAERVWFSSNFCNDASFRNTTFDGWTVFMVSFSDVWFIDAVFQEVGFSGTHFGGVASYIDATFNGTSHFAEASFSKGANFGGAAFNGQAWFQGTDFGDGRVSFSHPKHWDPAPKFDWDEDASDSYRRPKPDNVWMPATPSEENEAEPELL
jgi:uncharacterized protein YjbI with pentapeptide repeats